MIALAVFHGDSDHVLARFLKPGFRHVFVAVQNGNYWIMVDGCEGVPVVEVIAPSDFDMAEYFRAMGFTVVETEQRGKAPGAPLAVANCVGLAKAVLCLRAPFAITPYGLYKHLRKSQ